MRKLLRAAAPLLLGLPLIACEPAGDPSPEAPEPGALEPAAAPTVPARQARRGAHVALDGRVLQASYLCDGVDRPQVIAVLPPNAAGDTSIAVFDKVRFGAPAVDSYTLGPADPGAGQVYYPLLRDGLPAGSLHTVSPGALDAVGGGLPTLAEVKLGEEITRCRWSPGVRFLGFTAQRSVIVTRSESGGLAYTAFDFKAPPRASEAQRGALQPTTASLAIESGREDEAGGRRQMVFENDSHTYRVRVGSAAAGLEVSQEGAPTRTEPFVGWVYLD